MLHTDGLDLYTTELSIVGHSNLLYVQKPSIGRVTSVSLTAKSQCASWERPPVSN